MKFDIMESYKIGSERYDGRGTGRESVPTVVCL